MNRASPPQLRNCMQMADALMRAGIRFVPIPVLDNADFEKLVIEMDRKLEAIEKLCET